MARRTGRNEGIRVLDEFVCRAIVNPSLHRTKKQQTFAARLRALRDADGITQPELARRAGLATTAVAHLERGQREPTWDTVCKLAAALGVSTDEFRAA